MKANKPSPSLCAQCWSSRFDCCMQCGSFIWRMLFICWR